MTIDELRDNIIKFVEQSNVNLGRTNTKSRKNFIDGLHNFFKIFEEDKKKRDEYNKKRRSKRRSDKQVKNADIIMIKPEDNSKCLSAGKGVHIMTASESMRADEQLGRSPYSSDG